MKMKCGTWTYLICPSKLHAFKNNRIYISTYQINNKMKFKEINQYHLAKESIQIEESKHTRYESENVFDKFGLQICSLKQL